MIPFFQFISFQLGPLTLYVWGMFAALGFLAAFWVAAKEAKRRGIDDAIVWDAAPWIVLSAMIGSRLYAVFIDSPDYYLAHPGEIIKIWSGGLSVAGGILAASATGFWYLWRRGMLRWDVVESFIFALPLGLGIGRIGCFLIHDHPGTLTHLLWGVRYPDGVRHDLGLELAVFDFALFGFFLFLRRRKVPSGFYVFLFVVAKSLARLWLDFYRVWDGPLAEPRYGVLTATQYLGILVLCGTAIFYYNRSRERAARGS